MVVEGVRAGAHRSPLRGAGAEFQQHRVYRAGDDLRHLDWKLYARSERLFTREYRETTDLALLLVLDGSASMRFPEEGMSKWRLAQVVAASLAYLTVAQGGAVGLVYTDERGVGYIPPRGGVTHRSHVVARIDTLGAAPWRGADALRMAGEWARRRGIVAVLSDFYDDEDETLRELGALAHRGHDVLMLQTLAAEELRFTDGSPVELQDLETGARRTVDVAAVRASYESRLREFLERCRDRAAGSGVDHHLLVTDRSPADLLHVLLRQRAG